MFELAAADIAAAIEDADIKAVTKFPPAKLNRAEPVVCVSIKSARISASGCGNYIGLYTQEGQLCEMYGSKAELVISLEIYAPADPNTNEHGCEHYADLVRGILFEYPKLSVTSFEFGEVHYDTESEMFRCDCTAKAKAVLVRSLSTVADTVEYRLEETV